MPGIALACSELLLLAPKCSMNSEHKSDVGPIASFRGNAALQSLWSEADIEPFQFIAASFPPGSLLHTDSSLCPIMIQSSRYD